MTSTLLHHDKLSLHIFHALQNAVDYVVGGIFQKEHPVSITLVVG